ncbi:MAG: cupin domain-containing protein [Cyanobacteria bacterium SZAS TMP-1]|nr:cupin domain-containing protein [Cyanobacteria bacterium SZAS TMP-1]
MTECTLSDLTEYNQDKFLKKQVHSGPRSTVGLLHLLPGQEVPTHSHAGVEIMLIPQQGEGLLTVDGEKKVHLKPGLFFSELGENHTFSIKNNGTEPFQVLAVQVKLD